MYMNNIYINVYLYNLQNGHIYKYGHNTGHKWIPRHDSDGIRREIVRKKMRYLPGPVDLHILQNIRY